MVMAELKTHLAATAVLSIIISTAAAKHVSLQVTYFCNEHLEAN